MNQLCYENESAQNLQSYLIKAHVDSGNFPSLHLPFVSSENFLLGYFWPRCSASRCVLFCKKVTRDAAKCLNLFWELPRHQHHISGSDFIVPPPITGDFIASEGKKDCFLRTLLHFYIKTEDIKSQSPRPCYQRRTIGYKNQHAERKRECFCFFPSCLRVEFFLRSIYPSAKTIDRVRGSFCRHLVRARSQTNSIFTFFSQRVKANLAPSSRKERARRETNHIKHTLDWKREKNIRPAQKKKAPPEICLRCLGEIKEDSISFCKHTPRESSDDEERRMSNYKERLSENGLQVGRRRKLQPPQLKSFWQVPEDLSCRSADEILHANATEPIF